MTDLARPSRSLMRASLFLIFVTTGFGCLRQTTFPCERDQDCGAGGTCEVTERFCSFADPNCASNQRFDSSAGPFANTCVGGGGSQDGGLDGPATGCIAGYDPLAGGQATHKYKLIATDAAWAAQHSACNQTSGYLAIPDDAPELAALFGLATQQEVWLGIDDQVTETTFKDTKGQTYTALPIAGNNANNDCVEASAADKLTAKRCTETHLAICECEN